MIVGERTALRGQFFLLSNLGRDNMSMTARFPLRWHYAVTLNDSFCLKSMRTKFTAQQVQPRTVNREPVEP